MFNAVKNKINKKSIEFHVKSGDYFGTLATVISLMRQSENSSMQKYNLNILEKIETDLIFLQNKYKIIKKSDHN